MKTFKVVVLDAFNYYPLYIVASGCTKNDATAIANKIEEENHIYRCRVCLES